MFFRTNISTMCVQYLIWVYTRFVLCRYIYYNATDISSIDNITSNSSHDDLSDYYLSVASLNNDSSSYVTTSTGLIELNVGLASNRIYNVLYENVAYCLVAFLVPLATLVVFNVRLVVQLRRSRHLRRTLRPLVMYARDGPHSCRAGTHHGDGGAGSCGSGCAGQDETNITLVMIVIIVVFIICELPASANQVQQQRPDNFQPVVD